MTRLADHHVARPRLTETLEGTQVGIVEAGSGFGKTALTTEYGLALDLPVVRGTVESQPPGPVDLPAALRIGLRRAGLDTLALTLAVPDRKPEESIDALIDDLAGYRTPLLIVVDDAHHLGSAPEEDGEPLAALADRLPEPHRLLITGRRIPAPTGDALAVGAARIGAADMAFTAEEAARLCRDGYGVGLTDREAALLHQATGGWPAAVVMAAAGLARVDNPAARISAAARAPKLIAYLVEDLLAGFSPEDLHAVTQLAHLPLLGPSVAAATGDADIFQRTVDAGLPYGPSRDGWLEMAGPVREHLASLSRLDCSVARRAASIYERRREHRSAFATLLAAGADDEAAAALAGWPAAVVSAIDPREIRRLIESLPETAKQGHPRLFLHLARAFDASSDFAACRDALTKARAPADGSDGAVAREIDAEWARDLVRHAEVEEAQRIAEAVLTEASGNDLEARSRAHGTLGRVAAVTGEGPGAIRAAERHFEEAARFAAAAGMDEWAATDLTALAFYVDSEKGRDHRAIDALDRAVELAPAPGPTRANALSFRAITLQYLGRFDEAQADLDESRAIAEVFGDDRLQAYAFWQGAVGAGRRGDAQQVRQGLQATERLRGDWFDHPTGLEFLAEAAEAADLVGEHALAAQYAQRTRDRIATQAEPSAGFAATLLAMIEARSEDPAAGLAALESLDPDDVPERERWRVALLQGYAAWRLADPRAGALAARGFDLADAMGNPGLPFAQERMVAEALVALAAEAGSTAARKRAPADVAIRISVLGRLEVTQGGRPVEIPAGRPGAIVKVLAAAGGRMPTEALLEAIWPNTDPDSSRKALRNGLNRLRAAAGELVVRDGEMLAFGERVTVDAIVFEELAERALAARSAGGVAAAGLASRALAHYRQDLLPDDPYEPWAAERRERLRLLRMRLLDLLATVAEERGDADEAVDRLRAAIELAPYDEHRYVRAARLLTADGRYGEAGALARRGAAMLADLDVPPSPDLADLLRRFSNATD